MEPRTFEDDDDRRTERTVIGAELTGRVNGLCLLIASEEMVERPIRTGLSTRCAGHTRGHAMRHRSAGGTASPGDWIVRTAVTGL